MLLPISSCLKPAGRRHWIIICLFFFAVVPAQAQQNGFYFSPLSSVYYKDKIAQLGKYSVPKLYTDKSSQAWYDEIVTGRNKGLLDAFKEDNIIYDTLLLNKCYSIFNRIKAGNKGFNFDSISLYINRSVVANAANYGEGTTMVNAGLFFWLDNDDELAMVLGHEIAHQLLRHSDSKISKSIAMLTSDEFKEELKNIKRSEYNKFDRFRKLMKGLHVESGKHSTYKESEADSLGVVLAKNAGFDIAAGSKVLLKLDNVDELFTSDKLYTLKDFFEKLPVDQSYFAVKPKYNGLSSATVTMNADKDIDSIKTHPDCIKRFETIMRKTMAAGDKPVCCTSLNSSYRVYKERALEEVVRYEYENNAIGLCIHLCLFALKNNYNPAYYNDFLSLCFSKLYYRDKKLERFSAVNSLAGRNTNLKQLQDYLFDVSTTDLEKLSGYYLHLNTATEGEDYQFAGLMYETEVKMKDAAAAYAGFNSKFPNNKYQYLIPKK